MYVFRWTDTVAATKVTGATNTTNGRFILGPDWFLDETSGISYEVIEQGVAASNMLYQRVEVKSRDWIGCVILEDVNVPYLVKRSDEQGVWVSHGLWNTLYWRGEMDMEKVQTFSKQQRNTLCHPTAK